MSGTETNVERELAKEFILNTRRNVFLRGKAGTGKTTLLKEILNTTNKNYVIAAPTGVAAINAGGVTLHSLLSLPLRTFIPYRDRGHNVEYYYDGSELAKHQKFNKKKLQLLLELELLVIDEISMVRADTFDAIDQTLRRVRKNSQAFGGVQILVIGDMYQLSPVVRNNVQEVLSLYYKSPFFFDSIAWPNVDAVVVELMKVYRQEDQEFVDILNSIREGSADDLVLDRINANYCETADHSDTITLTTHNRKADKINTHELESLESESKILTAEVSGRFNENSYPNDEKIKLKVGAQVMFIRNHAEELYFNGKIGVITEIKDSFIKVKGHDNRTIIVEPVEWKNLVYEVEKDSGSIVQKEVGSYVQYPIRLAWAVTVHKSQGLTFDKVILDLSDTFASGQLYVALSRCRSLAGLVLTSLISKKNVIVDSRVKTFSKEYQLDENINDILLQEKSTYNNYRLQKEFDFNSLLAIIDNLEDEIRDNEVNEKPNKLLYFKELKLSTDKLIRVGDKFQQQLHAFFGDPKADESMILKRCIDAIDYFTKALHQELLLPTVKHGANYAIKKGEKKYVNALEDLEGDIWRSINGLYQIQRHGKNVYIAEPKYFRNISQIQKKGKKQKGETVRITHDLHRKGNSIALIAKERGLAIGTIESHFTKLIQTQKVSIFDIMKPDRVEKALKVAEAHPDDDLSDLIKKMPFKTSFGQVRWIIAYRDMLQQGNDA